MNPPGGIKSRQFIEHMEYKGHLYGTTFEAVEHVMRAGKTCVLHLQPQSLKKLRGSKLKPYIVLVKPPSYERLKVFLTSYDICFNITCINFSKILSF